jgi:hypothetical protein
MGSVWFSEQTAIISLNSVNQFIFVMVKCCVFFAVRTEFLNIIYTSFGFKGLISNEGYRLHGRWLVLCMADGNLLFTVLRDIKFLYWVPKASSARVMAVGSLSRSYSVEVKEYVVTYLHELYSTPYHGDKQKDSHHLREEAEAVLYLFIDNTCRL